MTASPDAQPMLPDYGGACISNIVPALLAHPAIGDGWMPDEALAAKQVVVFLIDGLGWDQLQANPTIAPVLHSMIGGPINTVAPSTTATALTSLTTGSPPGEHGVVGYRIRTEGATLNVLRWTTGEGDARLRIPPADFQTTDVFLGEQPPVVSRSEFVESGFTLAHLMPTDYRGYRTTASMIHETAEQLRAGARFTYAYYDGLDRIGHEYGHGGHYLAELAYVDTVVGALIERLPPGAALVVTADHGQVVTGDDHVEFHPDVARLTNAMSGEARFRWLHSRPGHAKELLATTQQHHGHQAWVVSADEAIESGWFGPVVSDEVRRRYGDVAVAATGVRAFMDPNDMGLFLIGRHGSLTSAEMRVPLLVAAR